MGWILYNIISLSSLIIAAILAYHDKSGWGWFLFVAIISMAVPTSNKNLKVGQNGGE